MCLFVCIHPSHDALGDAGELGGEEAEECLGLGLRDELLHDEVVHRARVVLHLLRGRGHLCWKLGIRVYTYISVTWMVDEVGARCIDGPTWSERRA